MSELVHNLKSRLAEINRIETAMAILSWDQSTNMPASAAESRAQVMATLTTLAQERKSSPELGQLLSDIEAKSAPDNAVDARIVQIAKQDYFVAAKVPTSFYARFAEHSGNCYSTWIKAKKENNFEMVAPLLGKTVELSREYSDYFSPDHVLDPLIDRADYGVKAKWLIPFFEDLRKELVPLVEEFAGPPPVSDHFLRQKFEPAKQLAFGEMVVKELGFDFERGRQDLAPHPFMTRFHAHDIRITTRIVEDYFGESFYSTVHEAGHALYELGIKPDFDSTPLGSGTSSAVHESQSRLWENMVARSRPFWSHFLPKAKTSFPGQFDDVNLDMMYCAVNRVEKTLIRTDADEVTYSLHILIRTQLEEQLLTGAIKVDDLPEAWNEAYRTNLGVVPPTDREGVLQDIHWYIDFVGGMFQGYALGNIIAAQVFAKARQDLPDLDGDFAQGKFDRLLDYLNGKIYQHGKFYDTFDLVQEVVGSPIDAGPYVAYLRGKYREVQSLREKVGL